MSIELNKVGVEIDGKTYQFYKLTFGFQRKLIEVQHTMSKLQDELAKKYNIDVKDVDTSELVTQTEKLELAQAGLALQDAIAQLFVNQDEAAILDNFDGGNIGQLIEALK